MPLYLLSESDVDVRPRGARPRLGPYETAYEVCHGYERGAPDDRRDGRAYHGAAPLRARSRAER